MGMRASIAYIDKKGISHITSLQWSTMLDKTLGLELNTLKEGESAAKRMRDVFRKSTVAVHASAVDVHEPYKRNAKEEARRVGKNTAVFREHTSEPATTYRKASYRKLANYHLDGGSIGAIYNEKKPNVITFFYEGETADSEDIEFKEILLDDLRAFYADEKAPLMKLEGFGPRRK